MSEALLSAARSGDFEVACRLIAAGAELDGRSDEGRTALHEAIEYGHGRIRDLLLESGAEVDVCAAAILGRVERLRLLLDRQPALVGDRSTGLSPLGWAAYGNQTETAAELCDRGARPDDGELLCAASVGHVEVGRLLIEHGADPDEVHPGAGGNALHAAASMRYTHDASAFVAMLLAAGADPKLRSLGGRTALEIAEEGAGRRCEGEDVAEATKSYPAVAALLRAALATALE